MKHSSIQSYMLQELKSAKIGLQKAVDGGLDRVIEEACSRFLGIYYQFDEFDKFVKSPVYPLLRSGVLIEAFVAHEYGEQYDGVRINGQEIKGFHPLGREILSFYDSDFVRLTPTGEKAHRYDEEWQRYRLRRYLTDQDRRKLP